METTKTTKTISQVFEEFLADQKVRIAQQTSRKYRNIIQLYGSYLESYWPGHDGESSKITKAGGTYCGTFGPEDVTGGYSEFLGYFMPRKVMCGKDLMHAAGTVTKKLAKWLADKGYIEDTEDAQEQAGEAAEGPCPTPRRFSIFSRLAIAMKLLQPSTAARSRTTSISTALNPASSG